MLSLRATGEGHISSITFRSGTIDAENRIRMDEPTRFVTAPEQVPNTLYDKTLFFRKLLELGVDGPFTGKVLGTLNDQFTLEELQRAINRAVQQSRPRHTENEPVVQGMLTLAKANYEISYSPEQHISERVIFPVLAHRGQRDRGRPVRPVPRRRRLGPLLRHLHRLRRQGDLAADPRDRRLPALQGQHPERARGPQQGLRALSAQGQRPLRHAVAAGQREHLPDVLGHAPLLVHQGADRQADLLVGVRAARQLRLAARDRGRLAGLDPRRRRRCASTRWVRSCSTSTTPPA